MQKDLQGLFEEYIEYVTHTRKLRSATIQGYKEVFRVFTMLMPEMTSPVIISSEKMSYFFKELDVRKRIVGKGEVRVGIKASTVMSYWCRLNSFFNWLEDRRYLEKNPLAKMKPAEPEYVDRKSFSKSNLERIIGAIDLYSKNTLLLKRDKAIIYLLFYTGIRKSELYSLRTMDVDLEKRILNVEGRTSKSKKTRELPINPTLSIHLKEYITERNKKGYKTEYLIVSNNKDGRLSRDGLNHFVKKLVRLSGVKFHLHMFRHTFACACAKNGIGSYKLQKLMGHTDLRMTDRYLRSMGVEDFRDDVNKLNIDNLI
ncbi:MAG: site-specific integrase [Patescibacteria group bacterium]|nr:site-specific integrase [Patescibacteria group bacterium]